MKTQHDLQVKAICYFNRKNTDSLNYRYCSRMQSSPSEVEIMRQRRVYQYYFICLLIFSKNGARD